MQRLIVRLIVCASCAAFLAALSLNPPVQAQAGADPSFGCMTQGTKVRNTYITHPDPAQLKEAVRIFENHVSGTEYPVGTMFQLVPGEAMIKRSRAEFPNTNGWEFFVLGVTAEGTTIRARGDAAANRAGTCLSCHQGAAKFDYVCERTHGCAPVPLTDEVIAKLQTSDARCAAR
jgi:hypothetical protein